jgi:ABC transporter substrate binding protein
MCYVWAAREAASAHRFRTIQLCPKDLPVPLRQAERADDRWRRQAGGSPMSGMRRREFIPLLGGVALWPLAARAQQAGKVHRIGFLGSATAAGSAKAVASLRTGLREFGYVEGTNIGIEFRWAEGIYDRLPHLVAELIATNVDVLITHGTPGTRVAKQATTTVPIVMAISGDAIATGSSQASQGPRPTSRDRPFFFHNSMQSDWNSSRRLVRASPVRPRSQIPIILSADRSFQRCRQPPHR